MSLSSRDRQALAAIAEELAESDRELATRLAFFSRLTVGEAMPVRQSRESRERQGRTGGGGVRAALLMVLWVVISVCLIVVAAVISRDDPSPCTVPTAAVCAVHHAPRGHQA
jgi:hypothetical protein